MFDRFYIQRLGDGLQQLILVKRFGNIIVGAFVHGLHRGFGGGISGYQNDDSLLTAFFRSSQDIQTGYIAKLYIAKQQVVLIFFEQFDRLAAVLGASDLVSLPVQHVFEQFTHAQLIVYDQYMRGFFCHSYKSGLIFLS